MLGECFRIDMSAHLHGRALVHAPLDRFGLGRVSSSHERRRRTVAMRLRPVDDLRAVLHERAVNEQNRQRAASGSKTPRQHHVHAWRPADLLVDDAVPVERPAGFLAIMRDAERDQPRSPYIAAIRRHGLSF